MFLFLEMYIILFCVNNINACGNDSEKQEKKEYKSMRGQVQIMSKKNKKNKNMEGTPNTGMTNSANPKAEKTASDYTKPAAENVKDSKNSSK